MKKIKPLIKSCLLNSSQWLFVLLTMTACDVFQNGDIAISEDFVRVYDINTNETFNALSISELSNNQGYLLYGTQLNDNLGLGVKRIPYILHVDIEGEVVWDTLLTNKQHLNMYSQKWVGINDKYYFLHYYEDLSVPLRNDAIACFDFETKTISTILDIESTFNTAATTVSNSAFTLAKAPNNTLVCSYYQCTPSKTSSYVIHNIDPVTGGVLWSSQFNNDSTTLAATYDGICNIAEADNETLPFQLGYYKNSDDNQDVIFARVLEKTAPESPITDAELSYAIHRYNANNGVFIDRIPYMGVNDLPSGESITNMNAVIYNDFGTATSSLLTLSTANFTSEEADIMIPIVKLDLNADSVLVSDNGFSTREYSYSAPLYLHTLTAPNGENYLFYVGTTWSGQTLICVFDMKPEGSGRPQILNKAYYGYKLYYEVRDFIITQDGGFAIFGYTLVSGRFQQFCMLKFSSNQLVKLVTKT